MDCVFCSKYIQSSFTCTMNRFYKICDAKRQEIDFYIFQNKLQFLSRSTPPKLQVVNYYLSVNNNIHVLVVKTTFFIRNNVNLKLLPSELKQKFRFCLTDKNQCLAKQLGKRKINQTIKKINIERKDRLLYHYRTLSTPNYS